MRSDNPSGADNQQETQSSMLARSRWVCGFVDGEVFLRSIHRNLNARSTGDGNSIPSLTVYQHVGRIVQYWKHGWLLGCGHVRARGQVRCGHTPWDSSKARVCDRALFQCTTRRGSGRLPSVRGDRRAMRRREHLTPAGFERLVHIAYAMMRRGAAQTDRTGDPWGSSETAR